MKTYELIAFDMDGTLLNSEKQILPSSDNAIKEAIDAGKIVSLSTGRCMPELEIFGSRLDNVPYFIGVSGALVYDNRRKKAICTTAMEENIVREIIKRAAPFDVLMNLLSWKSYMQSDKLERLEDYHMGVYRPMYEIITTRVENIRDYYEENQEEIPVFKQNIYCRSVEDRAAIRALLSDLPLELVDAETTSLECSPLGVSKAKGLRSLCDFLGIDIEKTIVVGDADNDIEILKAAGLSVAMGNANDRVKQIADVCVASCDEDGCAEAIHKYLLPAQS